MGVHDCWQGQIDNFCKTLSVVGPDQLPPKTGNKGDKDTFLPHGIIGPDAGVATPGGEAHYPICEQPPPICPNKLKGKWVLPNVIPGITGGSTVKYTKGITNSSAITHSDTITNTIKVGGGFEVPLPDGAKIGRSMDYTMSHAMTDSFTNAVTQTTNLDVTVPIPPAYGNAFVWAWQIEYNTPDGESPQIDSRCPSFTALTDEWTVTNSPADHPVCLPTTQCHLQGTAACDPKMVAADPAFAKNKGVIDPIHNPPQPFKPYSTDGTHCVRDCYSYLANPNEDHKKASLGDSDPCNTPSDKTQAPNENPPTIAHAKSMGMAHPQIHHQAARARH